MELSAYVLERLHEDDEFILYRGRAEGTDPPSILVSAPVSGRPTLETLKKIDHEYSFQSDLHPAWSARPAAVSRYRQQLLLVREDPGGNPLSHLIRGPRNIDKRQFKFH